MATTHIQSLEHGTCDSGKGLSNNMFIVYGVEAAWNKVLYFDYWAGTSIQPKHIYVNDSWIDSWYCCIFILASPCLNVSSLITFVARKKGDAEETVRLKPAPASTSMNIEGTSTLTVCLVFVLRLWFENFWTGGWTTRINLEYSRDPSKTFQNPGGYGDELGLRTSYNLWGGHWVMLRVFEFHRLKLRGKNALEQSWGSELQGWWVDPWFSPYFWRLIFVGEIEGFEPLVKRFKRRIGCVDMERDRRPFQCSNDLIPHVFQVYITWNSILIMATQRCIISMPWLAVTALTTARMPCWFCAASRTHRGTPV